MPTYALLGATGSTGSAILRCLLSSPPQDLTLNIFVRNKAKLLAAFPSLESTPAFKVSIFEGTPTDDSTSLRACLADVEVIFAVIASNVSTPGMSICYDTAAAIIAALKYHRQQQQQGPTTSAVPTVIQLRSASINETLKAAMPWLPRTMAEFIFHHCYADLRRASALFVSSSPGILHYIFVDPPAIHDPEGTTPTGFKLIVDGEGEQASALSYADLGAAFVEVAARREELRGREVGPTATGEVKLTVGNLLPFLVAGVRGRVWG